MFLRQMCGYANTIILCSPVVKNKEVAKTETLERIQWLKLLRKTNFRELSVLNSPTLVTLDYTAKYPECWSNGHDIFFK